jgi:UDP-2,4-diacetamido-2,4,6-trideoxy-beta-L-altropyranose hydrolase
MLIVFRVDASVHIGTGHVMRCLTLASALRRQGCEVVFVCRQLPGNCCDWVERQGFRVVRLPLPMELDLGIQESLEWETCEVAQKIRSFRRPDWLVVDHYSIDARWERAMRPSCERIMVIDDLANRNHDCDALLDQNLVADYETRYRDKLPAGCRTMLGPKFALLQSAYRDLRHRFRPRTGLPKRILVFFGGADADNLTGRVLALLRKNIRVCDLQIEVVVGTSNPHKGQLLKEIASILGARLHDSLPTLADVLLESDLAIGAGGTATWERCCLGVPALVVTTAENQVSIAMELDARRVIRWIGRADSLDDARLSAKIDEALREDLDPDWSQRCIDLVDGGGAERAAAFLSAGAGMPLVLREAAEGDELLLFEWANDPLVRRHSFTSTTIDVDGHGRWFRQRLANCEDYRIYIGEAGSGVPVGQVRFERENDVWQIGYSVDALFRGAGIGKRLLALAIERLRADVPLARIAGRVKGTNIASHHVFQVLGFIDCGLVGGDTEYLWQPRSIQRPGGQALTE